jgi:tetratricopeptide (TPR) repeat protein
LKIYYIICFTFLIYTLSISVANSNTSEKTYKLPPQGKDPRAFNQALGEKMFYSKDFKKAREAFEMVLRLENRDAQAHYFLGLIEYEEGNIDRAKARFQIAHECLSSMQDDTVLPIDDNRIQLEFPEEYKVRIYYKDGWYITPKDNPDETIYSLETGSKYRIRLEKSDKNSFIPKTLLGLAIAISFFLVK